MTPAFWISAAALVVTVFSSLLLIAFQLGKLSQRVTALEEDGDGTGTMKLAFAEFRGEVRGSIATLSDKFDGLRSDLTWLRTSATYDDKQARRP